MKRAEQQAEPHRLDTQPDFSKNIKNKALSDSLAGPKADFLFCKREDRLAYKKEALGKGVSR
jgi:hypothetical protein